MEKQFRKKSATKVVQKAASNLQHSTNKNTGLALKDNRTKLPVTQRMAVIPLATRLVRNVIFNGSSEELRQLLLQWAVPGGTQIQIQQTDFVGGSFNVRFTNRNGPAISIQTARGWIQTAKNHHQVDSSSDEHESDSD